MSKLDGVTLINSLSFYAATVLSSISISPASFMALSILMMVDFALGLGKSYRMRIPITSYRMKLGVISKVSMLLIVIAFGLAFTHGGFLIEELQDYVGWVLWVFILSELYSIVSNTYAIKVGEELPEFEVIAIIGGKLREVISKFIPNQTEDKE